MTIQSEIAQANYNRNASIHPGHVTRAETVTDRELRELLEHFTVSINAQNPTVHHEPRLDLRANSPAPRVAQLTAPERYVPVHDPERSVPVHNKGISRNTTASFISLAFAASMGWLLYTNPGFLEDEIKAQTHHAAFLKDAFSKMLLPAPARAVPANRQ